MIQSFLGVYQSLGANNSDKNLKCSPLHLTDPVAPPNSKSYRKTLIWVIQGDLVHSASSQTVGLKEMF